jgi:hypothetical protein
MAYTTVQDLFTGICDSIRAKEKTTAPINHQDIPTRIANLPTSSTCDIHKICIEGEQAMTTLMNSWINNSFFNFTVGGPYNDSLSFSGKMVTIFLMFKYFDNGEYYSFWVGGSATRGNAGYLSIGAIPWYYEGQTSPEGSITFHNDGHVSVSVDDGGDLVLSSNAYFIDIAGIAVSYDEGIAPSLGS